MERVNKSFILYSLILSIFLSSCGDEGGPTESKWRWIEEIPPGVSALTFGRGDDLIVSAGGPRFGSRTLYRWRNHTLEPIQSLVNFQQNDLSLYRADGQLYALRNLSRYEAIRIDSDTLALTALPLPEDAYIIKLVAITKDGLTLAARTVPEDASQAQLAWWRPGQEAWTLIPGSQHFAQAATPFPVLLSPDGQIVLLDNGQGMFNFNILVGDIQGMQRVAQTFDSNDNWSLSLLAHAPDGNAYILRPGRQLFGQRKAALFHVSSDGQLRQLVEFPSPHVRAVGLSSAPSGEVFAFFSEDNSPNASTIFRYDPSDKSLQLVKEPEGINAYWSYVVRDANTIYKYGEANGPSDGYGVWRLDL